jgi:lysozyme
MTTQREHLQRLLRLHEGVRLKPYRDTVGKLTIGIGRNLDDRGITEVEADLLLEHDLDDVWLALIAAKPWIARLDEVRQAVLIDMGVNLGVAGLLKFKQTLAAIERGDYETAAVQMLDSKWATQVGRRAQRLARMMRDGVWPFEIQRPEERR